MASTHYEIVDHWSMVEDESGLAIDWAEAHERCWRCGYKAKLERCHIVPDALGGAATPDNLVLLCSRCHREAPNHENPIYMWRWLRIPQ
ncbi:HNH endonuclease [Nocardia yamanashiensis]|uniref:HNH endonuclease n=1 Tax=Nocardia yamanashiensis TaxID=209247 RepID=UPI0038CD9AE0